MSLYSNFTLKEWLAFHCTTKDIDDAFRKALKDNDEPMAVLALSELIKRGDTDLVTYAIQEATDEGCFAPGSHFSTVFTNALTQYGSRDPALRRISKNVRRNGFWPKTSAELFNNTSSASCEKSTPRSFDNRLDLFLESFMYDGLFSVEFGLITPSAEPDFHGNNQTSTGISKHCNLVIKGGFIMNREEISNALEILDTVGILKALPTFNGYDSYLYTLNEHGDSWVGFDRTKDIFYMTYYPVE